MSDLVTGEAVVLDLQTAKLPSRALAIVLDLVVEFAALLLVSLVLSITLIGLDGAALAALLLGLLVFFLVAVPVMVETLSHGRSLGKAALGLRVVRSDGGPVRFRHSLVRGLVGFMELIALTGVPAVIASMVNADGRRLGDVFAGTVVVRERTPGGAAASPLPPVHPHLLQSMGRELVAMDLSAVPEPLWLAVRQLLGRIGQLDRSVALRMATGLADDVADRTGLPVAPGLHPAAYLGAVLTERQRREWSRAQEQWRTAAAAAPVPPHAPAQAHQPTAQDGRPLRVLGVPTAPAPAPAPTPAPAPAAPSFEKPAAPAEPPAGTGFAPPA
ncbi:RDD family protein [Kitasatospora sp. NPDC101176]|uniref:RDD family protein n=1 Tax=Kitasatospora sp. NPDC101176 TaxID=3364099 RepID=UPI0037F78C6B